MSIYDADEEQQVEAIKDWWRSNGKAVVIGVVVGIGGIMGWRTYESNITAQQVDASHAYTQVIQNLTAKGLDAQDSVQSFIDQHDKTNYAILAALQLSKAQVEAGQLAEALTQLQWAQANTSDKALLPLISYRTARVQAAQENFDDAIATLTKVDSESWSARNQELLGDIYLLKGDKDSALKAYTQAQQDGSTEQSLQLKIDDLAK